MKRKTLYLILLIIVLVSAIFPIIITKDSSAYFNYFIGILGALSTLFTVIIAILLYDRFSIEREMLSKQAEAVSSLVQNLNIGCIYISLHTDKETKSYYFEGDYKQWKNYPQEFVRYSLCVTENVYRRLSNITRNVPLFCLPEEIYSNCAKLLGYYENSKSIDKHSHYAVIRFINPLTKMDINPDELTSNENLFIIGMTLGEFCDDLINLFVSVDDWFEKHGYNNPRLQMTLYPNAINAKEFSFHLPQNNEIQHGNSKSRKGRKGSPIIFKISNDNSSNWQQYDIEAIK